MDKAVTTVVTILTLIIGVAIIAVLVSKNSNTANVLTAAGKSFSSILSTALSPVSQGSLTATSSALPFFPN